MNKDLRIVQSKHVTFDESKVYGDYCGKKAKLIVPLSFAHNEICECCQIELQNYNSDDVINPPSDDELNHTDHEAEVQGLSYEEGDRNFVPVYEPPLTQARFQRNRNNDDDYDIIAIEEVDIEDAYILIANKLARPDIFEPKTYKQATTCADKKAWKAAMDDKIRSLIDNDTWIVVPNEIVPKDASEVTCQWLYCNQLKTNYIQQKARVIAQGFKDKHKYRLEELYAPVSCILDIQLILHFANKTFQT